MAKILEVRCTIPDDTDDAILTELGMQLQEDLPAEFDCNSIECLDVTFEIKKGKVFGER